MAVIRQSAFVNRPNPPNSDSGQGDNAQSFESIEVVITMRGTAAQVLTDYNAILVAADAAPSARTSNWFAR